MRKAHARHAFAPVRVLMLKNVKIGCIPEKACHDMLLRFLWFLPENLFWPASCKKLYYKFMAYQIGDKMDTNSYKYITDLRSERLFREAEDDFYFFGKIKLAQKKLQKALTFSPFYVKALILLANIAFYQGDIESASDYFRQAEKIDAKNINVLCGLANINEVSGNNEEALRYINEALASKRFFSPLLRNMLTELKVSVLIKLKRYKEAEVCAKNSSACLEIPELWAKHSENLTLLKEKFELQQKIKNRQLKLVK